MPDGTQILVGAIVFAFTATLILIHLVEWTRIWELPRLLNNGVRSRRATSRLLVVKSGLVVEMVYYFSLLIAFGVHFSAKIVFLVLVALLGILHFVAFESALGKKKGVLLRVLTSRRVTGLLLFDLVELAILMAVALEFYPYSMAVT